MKNGSFNIGSCAKLTPQFCECFIILERIRPITDQLALPQIVKFPDFFHVSLLEKYVKDVDLVIDWYVLQLELEGEFQLKPQCIL